MTDRNEARGIEHAPIASSARVLATVGLLAQFHDVLANEDRSPPSAGRVRARLQAPVITIRRDGEMWLVACGDASARMRDDRGMQLLAELVANPGRELHVLQLAVASDPASDRSHVHTIDVGDAGPMLDRRALASYRNRLLDLRGELEEAERFADTARSEKARAEIEMLDAEIARGVGLGGRDRRAAGAAERARTSVQQRLREAIRRVHDELPDLGLRTDHPHGPVLRLLPRWSRALSAYSVRLAPRHRPPMSNTTTRPRLLRPSDSGSPTTAVSQLTATARSRSCP